MKKVNLSRLTDDDIVQPPYANVNDDDDATESLSICFRGGEKIRDDR